MIRWLLDLVYPPRCVLCHKLLDSSREPVCNRCGRLVLSQNASVLQGDQFRRCVSPLKFDGVVRESVHRFKFGGRGFYGKTYALWMAAAISQQLNAFDIVTWVPVSRNRKRKRGYDQSFILCRHVAKLLDAEMYVCLKKVRDNPAQSTISDRNLRKENVKGAYCALKPERFTGKRILLVDDVVTTGATLDECSRVLRKSGAIEIQCATVARA